MSGFLTSAGVWTGAETDLPPRLPLWARYVEPLTDFDTTPELDSPQVVSPEAWASASVLPIAFLFKRQPVWMQELTEWEIVPPDAPDTDGNVFTTLPVPVDSVTPGQSVFVGNTGCLCKTLAVSGLTLTTGNLFIAGSMNGTRWVRILSVSFPGDFNGDTAIRTLSGLWAYLRVERDGSGGAPYVDVGAGPAGGCS